MLKIKGKGLFNPDFPLDASSMLKALFVTKDLIKNRADYQNFRANALDKKIRPSDNEEEDEIIEDS